MAASLIETAEATVWLYYAGDDDAAISRLVDLRGDLPCKSGGEVRDWAEASSAYFRAALRRARAERLLQSSREGSEKYVDADRERTKAIQELNETLRRFETAVERDAGSSSTNNGKWRTVNGCVSFGIGITPELESAKHPRE